MSKKPLGQIHPLPKPIALIAQRIRRQILKKYGTTEDACWTAAQLLVKELRRHGHSCRIQHGKFRVEDAYPVAGHSWVEIKGRILDITADQFNPRLRTITMRAIVHGTPKELSPYKK